MVVKHALPAALYAAKDCTYLQVPCQVQRAASGMRCGVGMRYLLHLPCATTTLPTTPSLYHQIGAHHTHEAKDCSWMRLLLSHLCGMSQRGNMCFQVHTSGMHGCVNNHRPRLVGMCRIRSFSLCMNECEAHGLTHAPRCWSLRCVTGSKVKSAGYSRSHSRCHACTPQM